MDGVDTRVNAPTFSGMKRVRINAYIKPWLKRELELFSQKSGDSESEIVSKALENSLPKPFKDKGK